MPKNSYIRILLLFGMALVITLTGCVDTSVNPIPSTIDYRSNIKVVNFAEGVSSADFNMTTPDGTTIALGTIAFGNEDHAGSAFMDIPAGSKTLTFNSESYRFSTEVDKKIRVFIVGSTVDKRDIVKFSQRYIFQTSDDPSNSSIYRQDSAAVAFINGSSDAVIDQIDAVASSGTTTISSASLEQGDMVSYTYLKAGQYTFNFMSGDSTISSLQTTVASQKRYTAAVYGTSSSLQNKVFTDD